MSTSYFPNGVDADRVALGFRFLHLRDVVSSVLGTEELRGILRALATRARKGDVDAARLVLALCLDRP